MQLKTNDCIRMSVARGRTIDLSYRIPGLAQLFFNGYLLGTPQSVSAKSWTRKAITVETVDYRGYMTYAKSNVVVEVREYHGRLLHSSWSVVQPSLLT